MSEKDDGGRLFEAVCHLDDAADMLESDRPDEAAQIRALSQALKQDIVLVLREPAPTERQR